MSLQTTVKTKVKSKTALLAIVAVAAVSAAAVGISIFGGGLAGVVTLPGSVWTCAESNETANNVDPATIPYYSTFLTNTGGLDNVKYFDITRRSAATCQKNSYPYSKAMYEDTCLIDVGTVVSGKTTWQSTKVAACSKADEDGITKRNCRLQEGFVKNATSTSPAVSNWTYKCLNGCDNGACLPVPDLEISRIFYTSTNNIDVEIKNNNTAAPAGPFRVKYTIDGITDYTNQLSLSGTSMSVRIADNLGGAGGNHSIAVVADDDNKAIESNENNNSLAKTLATCRDTDDASYPSFNQSRTDTPYFKGTCTDATGDHVDACSGSSVTEYYFAVTYSPPGCACAQRSFTCPAGCNNGACIATATCTATDDPDNSKVIYGANLEVNGTTTGRIYTGATTTMTDICSYSYPDRVQESFCTYMNAINPNYVPVMTWGTYTCPAGKTCVSGACQ